MQNTPNQRAKQIALENFTRAYCVAGVNTAPSEQSTHSRWCTFVSAMRLLFSHSPAIQQCSEQTCLHPSPCVDHPHPPTPLVNEQMRRIISMDRYWEKGVATSLCSHSASLSRECWYRNGLGRLPPSWWWHCRGLGKPAGGFSLCVIINDSTVDRWWCRFVRFVPVAVEIVRNSSKISVCAVFRSLWHS